MAGDRRVFRIVILAIEKRVLSGGEAMPWRFDLAGLSGGIWEVMASLRLGEAGRGDGDGVGVGMMGEVVTSTLATLKTGCGKS